MGRGSAPTRLVRMGGHARRSVRIFAVTFGGRLRFGQREGKSVGLYTLTRQPQGQGQWRTCTCTYRRSTAPRGKPVTDRGYIHTGCGGTRTRRRQVARLGSHAAAAGSRSGGAPGKTSTSRHASTCDSHTKTSPQSCEGPATGVRHERAEGQTSAKESGAGERSAQPPGNRACRGRRRNTLALMSQALPRPTHTGGIECSVGRDPAPTEPLSATWWQTGANTVPLLYELQGLHGEKRSTNWCAEATPARGQEKAHALSMGPKRQALVVESHRVQQMSYEQAALIDRQYVRRVHAHGPPSQIPTGRGRWQVIACGVPGILWVQDARVD